VSGFARDVRVFAKKAKLDTRQVIRAVTLEISTSIILRTPVDTGRARNGWRATIDKPSAVKGRKADPAATAALGTVRTAVSDIGGNIYYLTNNLPYIRRLEYEGWSTQAPAGMMRVSASEYAVALRKKIAEMT